MFKFRPSALQRDIEPQEIFLDRLAKKREEEMGISGKKLEAPLPARVLQVLAGLFLILGFLLFCKTFQLQVLEAKTFKREAEANQFIVQSLQATRGVVYDRNDVQLVSNSASFDLVCEGAELPSQALEILAGEPAENLSQQKLILLETKIDQLEGCRIQRNSARVYQDGPVFSHVLGYTGYGEPGADSVGRDGLERTYEQVLTRQSGKLRLERDALGNLLSTEVVSPPQPGENLHLWLDARLQKKVSYELEQWIKAAGSSRGAAVMLDAHSGGVLALVSFPGFDNNLFAQESEPQVLRALLSDPQSPLFNRAIAGQYAPGSTIKPLVAAAALQEEMVDPEKAVDCQGFIAIPHQYDPELITYKHDWQAHGLTDLRKAIAVSCNTYFYILGGGYKIKQGLGPSKIKEYLGFFGWGKETGVDLPGEKPGLLPDKSWKEAVKKERWWDGDTYNLAIGQGDILVTPLQVAAAFVAIANGGTLYQPQLVQAAPKIVREDFISPQNLQIVREGMRQAVTYGSAANWLNALPVSAAAKTGTAQTSKPGYYHNWVTVFAPYDDPQIVLTVMIEDVKSMQAVVLPIAREILTWYFSRPR